MEEIIREFILTGVVKPARLKETFKLPVAEKKKIRMLAYKKQWVPDWRKEYKTAKVRKYIEVNFALMLLHSEKILTWQKWQKHKKFCTTEIYEKLFS
jgi:hypothetical protein